MDKVSRVEVFNDSSTNTIASPPVNSATKEYVLCMHAPIIHCRELAFEANEAHASENQ